MLPFLPPLVARARAHGRTATAIVDASGTYTYEHLDRTSARIAHILLAGRDDLSEARVAFLITPGFAYVATLWGIWRAGGTAVPLPIAHPAAELEHLVRDSESSTIVADEDGAPVVEALATTAGAHLASYESLLDGANDTPR